MRHAWLIALALANGLCAFGHDMEIRQRLAAPAVVLHAAYAGTEAVAFAKVQVYSPAEPDKEFQAANTDKRGAFSFVPDRAGNWRVVIDDEIGHRQEAAIQVPEGFSAGSASLAASGGASRIERAVTGIALLLGLTGFWYGYSRRSLRP